MAGASAASSSSEVGVEGSEALDGNKIVAGAMSRWDGGG